MFITGGERFRRRTIASYRLGAARARVLDVTVGDFYGMAALEGAGERRLGGKAARSGVVSVRVDQPANSAGQLTRTTALTDLADSLPRRG